VRRFNGTRYARRAHGVSIISIATATHLLGDLDLEILETAARPGYGTSLPVRKHRGEPGHNAEGSRARTPTSFPTGSFPPSTLNIHTTPRPGREPQGPDQLSLLSTQSQTRTMPILEWPKYLEARWIVRGDTKASYDNSRLARHARRAAFLRRLRGIRLRIRVRTVSLKNTKQKNRIKQSIVNNPRYS